MIERIGAALFGAAMLAAAAPAAAAEAEEGKVVYMPLSISALEEFGVLQSGRYGNNPRFRDDWTDHFGAFVTQTVLLNEKLSFNVGLGGLFQYQKREVVQSGWGSTQYKNFFIGPTVADLVYRSAPAGETGFGLQFGLFPYKYNPTAYNLGEYLFRAGPYPAFFFNGTYAMVNSTAFYLQGLKTSFYAGGFNANLLLTTETTLPALYDFSLAGILKYRTAGGLLDLGAGANLKHLIPVRPSRTSPQHANNAYFERNGKDFTSNTTYYQEHADFYTRIGNTADAAIWQAWADSVGNDNRPMDGGNPKTVGWRDSATGLVPGSQFFTQAGAVLSGNITLDPKALFQSGVFGAEDLKLYAEVALLGVTDYPLFYTSKSERMPVMFGFNLPGFHILDLIAVQVEYFNSPWMNSYAQVVGQSGVNAAVPAFLGLGDPDRSQSEFNDISKDDNLSWTLLLKKQVVRGAWVSGQLARDHTRLVSVDTWAGPGVEPNEVLSRGPESLSKPFTGDWYWMVQFSFGI